MRACAPGKLLLSGAYAVLGGAPAIVCAVDRHAYATRGDGPTTREVSELGEPVAVDVRELQSPGGDKLGLGSSAAALVAAIALMAAERGDDVEDATVRATIFERARAVHARVQGGGSGVDVAASTYGGVLHFEGGRVRSVALPANVRLEAVFSGASARTSVLRERVDALAAHDAARYVERISALAACAVTAAAAIDRGDGALFVSAVAGHLGALEALGSAADAPIVLPPFAELGRRAVGLGGAFIPSGAGGGDLGVWVGTTEPPASFKKEAERLAMTHVPLHIDSRGVHLR